MQMKEADLSPLAKRFLLDQGCTEIYGEVRDIDLVGKQGQILYAVELKLKLNIKVLEQAASRKDMCNYIYIAVPKDAVKDYYQLSPVYKLFLEHHNLGLITLSEFSGYYLYHVIKHPKFNRLTIHKHWLLPYLNEFSRDKDGGHTTATKESPYKYMIYELKEFMQYHHRLGKHWLSINQIIQGCESVRKHYSNPRAGIRNALTTFESSWCESKIIDGKLHFKIKEIS